jgi:hypothetical protein
MSTAVTTAPLDWTKLVTEQDDGTLRFEIPCKFDYIEAGKLFVDYHESFLAIDDPEEVKLGYQRKRDRIYKKITKTGPNKDLLGVFMVNYRRHLAQRGSNGEPYAITDGGTRFRALRALGLPDNVCLPCLVYGWTPKDEIKNYVEYNQERAGLSPVDVFIASVRSSDQQALAIEKLLMDITDRTVSARSGDWACVNALTESHDHRTLRSVLEIIRDLGWLDMTSGRTQQIVGAVDRCLWWGGADPKRCVTKWRGLTPANVKAKATALHGLGDIGSGSRSIAKYYAVVLGNQYDSGRTPIKERLNMAQRLFNLMED